jgi:hypothetical protein
MMECLATEEGIEVETAEWESRLIYYCIGRKVHHGPEGSLSSTNLAMCSLI